jgi:uncharacterized RDD family membrane protein YckC
MEPTPMASQQRYAPPMAEVADVAGTEQALAGRGARLAASIIDGVVLMVLLWLASLVTPWNVFSSRAAQGGFTVLLGIQLLAFLLFMAVNGVLLIRSGQTIGKKLMGMRIVRSDGSAATPGRLIGLRYGLWWLLASVPFIGGLFSLVDALAIFRQSRQCLHDSFAGTIVVKT